MELEGDPSEGAEPSPPLRGWTDASAPARPAPRQQRATPSGLELVADLAPPGALAAALKSVREAGVDLLDALMASAAVDGDALVRRLGRRLGLATLAEGDPAPPAPALAAPAAGAALRSGLMTLGDGRLAVAARGAALRRLVNAARGPVERRRIVLVTPRRFAALAIEAGGTAFIEACRDRPERQAPQLSARPLMVARSAAVAFAMLVALAVAVLIWAPSVGHAAVSLFFLLLAAVRLAAVGGPAPRVPARPGLPARELPIYSIAVPLYRESRALAGLLDALAALDYPAAKLDIKLVVERDDSETARALAALRIPGHIEVLSLPAGPPRTKPRALNVALAAARGTFLTIYDAEDRPEPGQLRAALAAFAAGPPHLACVQAALTVDNSRDGWLTRLFTIEYAALFDAFLPSLAAFGMPFPLGGSSNHFRTAAVRAAGGWDPWNVTEDAELGLRLARRGYRMTTAASSTYEEAPNRFGPWMRQRTRWLKGYALTWWIHACRPRRLLADLGWPRFLVLNAIVAGVPLSALTLPILFADLAWRVRETLSAAAVPGGQPLAVVDVVNLVVGFGAAAVAPGLLAPVLASRLSGAGPARRRAPPLGEDRARPRPQLAPRGAADAVTPRRGGPACG